MTARSVPFSRAAVLALVGGGTALFMALLWMFGAGMVHGPLNDGGAPGAGKGLTGFAAFSGVLERRGWEVTFARTDTSLASPGLVVLTPPADADGRALERLAARRARIGPTMVIAPKWTGQPLGRQAGTPAGWVVLAGTAPPRWDGFLDDVGVSLQPDADGRWVADGATGTLPAARVVLSGDGDRIVPLVELRRSGRILAGYVADGGRYPALDALALQGTDAASKGGGRYPLVLVFEPDLLDNYGLRRPEGALYGLRLAEALRGPGPRSVTFDLTYNGFARRPNLLTLAFEPPFLAATLCLLLAASLVAWRAFARFGPAAVTGPQLAFGKRQLVANGAGLVRRSKRLHLLGPPYAALVRDRLTHALGLPQHAGVVATEAAIDRALAARDRDAPSFTTVAARLCAARRPIDLVRAAHDLHALERTLQR